MHAVLVVMKALVEVAVFLAENVFGLLRAVRRSVAAGLDALHNLPALTSGVLRCPRGHAVPTDGERYECTVCGFTYEGSVWVCGNPECGAVTPYTDCPTCGLSVRSPYRWGEP